MRIIQLINTVSFGDAVGNDARELLKVIADMGYKTGIYAENIDIRIKNSHIHEISKLPKLSKDDIVIFNHSTGTEICDMLPKLDCRKLMIYHNITPPEFFSKFCLLSEATTKWGYDGTKKIKDEIDHVMAVSEYNAADLREMGYSCPMTVRPILIPFDDYKKEPDKHILEKYKDDGYTNIVFVGRIAPNKKQEDLIKAFAYYKKHVNSKSRLILVGNDGGMEKYSLALKKYAAALMVDDIVFTGHIRFNEILAYYKIADVFLCMSEHEGFCVPLVEAMFFDVPIIAYNSSAIPDTLGGSGILIDNKDPIFVSYLIDKLEKDKQLRDSVIKKQRERLKDFSYDVIKEKFVTQLKDFIKGR